MMRNEETIQFVREHREEDVRALALQARRDGEGQVAHRAIEVQDAVERRALAARVQLEVPGAGLLDLDEVAVLAARH